MYLEKVDNYLDFLCLSIYSRGDISNNSLNVLPKYVEELNPDIYAISLIE